MYPLGHAEILRTLVRHGVDFIVVGGMAGALQGAPVHTQDIDIVHARTAENVERLLAALHELDAWFRMDLNRKLAPNASHLVSPGHQLLRTKHGILDVLGTIEETSTYEDLVGDTKVLEVAGVQVRVLSLERLISVKEKLSRPKDKVMLMLLQATLEERNRVR
jgi:predicted nucleotidyltransferase